MRYGWIKPTLEPSPESFPYNVHLEHYSYTRRLRMNALKRANSALLSRQNDRLLRALRLNYTAV